MHQQIGDGTSFLDYMEAMLVVYIYRCDDVDTGGGGDINVI